MTESGERKYQLSEADATAVRVQIAELRIVVQGLLGRENSAHPDADREDVFATEARIRELEALL
jgi:hypothetical protein